MRDFIRRLNNRVTNPIMMEIGGKPHSPIAVIRHAGRRSGKQYQNPIMAHPMTNGFLFALTYGPAVTDLSPAVAIVPAPSRLRCTSWRTRSYKGAKGYQFQRPSSTGPKWTAIRPRHGRTLSQYESVALFIPRSKAAKCSFTMTDQNAPAVAEICSRLDGLPPAIELATARIKLFPPQALLHRVDRRLTLLTRGARDRPSRQQTLLNPRATLRRGLQRRLWRFPLRTFDPRTGSRHRQPHRRHPLGHR